MKVGDLIKLSAYGKKRLYNSKIAKTEVGLIVGFNPNLNYPYKVRWTKAAPLYRVPHSHSRRELKYACLE